LELRQFHRLRDLGRRQRQHPLRRVFDIIALGKQRQAARSSHHDQEDDDENRDQPFQERFEREQPLVGRLGKHARTTRDRPAGPLGSRVTRMKIPFGRAPRVRLCH
jgi:hypothetical protein